MAGWTTVEQVLTWTGKDVEEADILLASAVIDTYAGTDYEQMTAEDALWPRDLRVLAKATAWQAVWMPSQPGYLDQRSTARSVSADGVNVQRSSQADADLAPLAARELKNLSWVGSRTVNLRPRAVTKGAMFLSERSDDLHPWSPV